MKFIVPLPPHLEFVGYRAVTVVLPPTGHRALPLKFV